MEDNLRGVTREQILDSFGSLEAEEQARLVQEALTVKQNLIKAGKEDSPESFAAFFHIMEGVPLTDFAMEAIQSAYSAHAAGMGSLHEWFRESGKTTVFSKNFLLYRIAKEPWKTNMVIRINDDKANETTLAIANTIKNNPYWKMMYGNIVPDPTMGWGAKGYYVRDLSMESNEWEILRNRSPQYPSFVGYGWKSGSIVGSRINGCAIIDDIHDNTNSSSARILAEVKRWYTEVFYYCVMAGAWELWNFTPWQFNDLYSDLRVNKRRYVHNRTPVITPAKKDDYGAKYWEKDSLVPYSGRYWNLTWESQWDFKRIGDKYLAKPAQEDEFVAFAFERQMLLDLEATKGVNLKAEWLHAFPVRELDPAAPVFFGIDYASTPDKTKTKGRDYFAMAIMRAIPGGGLCLIDGTRRHVTKPEALQLVAGYMGVYPTLKRIGVETIAKGEEFYSDLLLMQDTQRTYVPLESIKHGRVSKGDRFEGWLAPRFQRARLWVADVENAFIREFKNEWLGWDNYPNDDCIDAVYMCAQAAQYFMPDKTKDYVDRYGDDAGGVNPYSGFGGMNNG